MKLFESGIQERNWAILNGKPIYIYGRAINSHNFIIQTGKEELMSILPYDMYKAIPIYNPHDIDIFGQKPLQLISSLKYTFSGSQSLCLCDNGDFSIDPLGYSDCARATKGSVYTVESYLFNQDGGHFVKISGEWHHASFFFDV